MTTGRINQVTIVRRGWPTGAREGAGESVQVTGGRPRMGRASRRSTAGPRRAAPLGGNPLSPSSFPRASVHAHRRLPAVSRRILVRYGRPERRTQRAASAIAASATRGCLLLLCFLCSPAARQSAEPSRPRWSALGALPRKARRPQ
jgi:hypothetical protein